MMEGRPGRVGTGRRALARTAVEIAVMVACAAVVGAMVGLVFRGDILVGAIAGMVTGVVLGMPLIFLGDTGRLRQERWRGDPPRGDIHEPPYEKGGRG